MTNKSVSTPGDTLSIREQATLGKYRNLGLLRYKDPDAGYCRACYLVYGVECPNCHIVSDPHDTISEQIFTPDSSYVDFSQGQHWIKVECRKCSTKLKVLVQPLR